MLFSYFFFHKHSNQAKFSLFTNFYKFVLLIFDSLWYVVGYQNSFISVKRTSSTIKSII